MITPTSAWSTEFAKRQRKPLYVVEIEDYHYALTSHTYSPANPPTPTGFALTPPVALTGTQRVVWAWPSAASAGPSDPGATNGSATASALGSGEVTFTSSGPLANNEWESRWSSFVAPSLPGDAVIVAMYPTIAATRTFTLTPAAAYALYTSGGIISNSNSLFDGQFHGTTIGSSLSVLSGFSMSAHLEQSLSIATMDDDFVIHQVGVAIYYTSATEDAGGGSSSGVGIFKPWLKPAPQDLELTVDDLSGSATLGQLSFDVIDLERLNFPILADMPTFVFEGKRVTLKIGTTALDYPDLLTVYTGVVESVASMSGNLGWTFTCNDGSANLDSVIWTIGDDGQPTDSDHPRTIQGNPIDILLSILETDLEIDLEKIDVTRMEEYRDTYFAGMEFSFSITDPPQARDFIQKQLMVPLGGILWINNLGVHTVRFMAPLDGDTDPVMTLTETDLSETPVAGQADLINTISFRFDKNDGGSSSSNNDYLSISIQNDAESIAKYGLYGEHIIESDGLRASSQGFFIASFVARMIFLRYGNKNLTFTADGQWQLALLEPFDLVQVTHPRVPDRVNGVFGITDWLLQVLDRTYMFGDGKVEIRVVDASEMARYGRFKIAPDGMDVWTSATTDEKERYMFLSEDTGLMSNGDTAPILG